MTIYYINFHSYSVSWLQRTYSAGPCEFILTEFDCVLIHLSLNVIIIFFSGFLFVLASGLQQHFVGKKFILSRFFTFFSCAFNFLSFCLILVLLFVEKMCCVETSQGVLPMCLVRKQRKERCGEIFPKMRFSERRL